MVGLRVSCVVGLGLVATPKEIGLTIGAQNWRNNMDRRSVARYLAGMFRHLKPLLLGICLLSGCGGSTATAPSSNNAEAKKAATADNQTRALPANLAFVPRDATMVVRLDISALVQSFLWTDVAGPQLEKHSA